MFRVYDYTDATRLFGQGFTTRPPSGPSKPGEAPPVPPERTILVEGFDVHVTDAGQYIVTCAVDPLPPDPGRAGAAGIGGGRGGRGGVHPFPGIPYRWRDWADPEGPKRLLPERADSERSWTVTREAIEAKNYDLKAVNPHARSQEDRRTPEELLDLIEAKGREVAEAVAALRALRSRADIAP